MPVTNTLSRWRRVIVPAPARALGYIESLLGNGVAEVRLDSGPVVRANMQGSSYQVSARVLLEDGVIVRQVADLSYTEQAV